MGLWLYEADRSFIYIYIYIYIYIIYVKGLCVWYEFSRQGVGFDLKPAH